MGGFILTSPDYPNGFPIDAEQLFYLVQHQHVDFPALTNDDIRDRNKSDNLTKILTLGQVFFFLVNEFWRIGQGYPITTLELTTITFSFLMLGTSVAWYFKPVISSATVLRTRDNRTILDIRRTARTSTHPELQHTWYRTPLAFLSRHNFHFDRHWAYYSNVSFRLHLPLFGREVTATPWDRIPSDIWYPLEWAHPDVYLIPLALLVLVPFCVSFLGAWFFAFPTRAEHVIWRVCAIYHAAYSLVGTFYFTYVSYRDRNGQRSLLPKVSPHHEMISYPVTRVPSPTQEPISSDNTELERRLPRSMTNLKTWAASLRNISPDQDPDMEIPLRWTSAFFFPTVLYIFCRLYFYIEDLISLRSQPAGVYSSVERIFPFI